MSKEELTEKLAEYENTQKSLKNNEAEIKLPIHIVWKENNNGGT